MSNQVFNRCSCVACTAPFLEIWNHYGHEYVLFFFFFRVIQSYFYDSMAMIEEEPTPIGPISLSVFAMATPVTELDFAHRAPWAIIASSQEVVVGEFFVLNHSLPPQDIRGEYGLHLAMVTEIEWFWGWYALVEVILLDVEGVGPQFFKYWIWMDFLEIPDDQIYDFALAEGDILFRITA